MEWNYARVLALFGGLRMAKAFKLHLSPIGHYYRVAVIFCNLHCCLNGNNIHLLKNLLKHQALNALRSFAATTFQGKKDVLL